jgi:hypothetical protein
MSSSFDERSSLELLFEDISKSGVLGIVPVNKYPWITPTIIGRLGEELGITTYLILTSIHVESTVDEGLMHIKDNDLHIYIDSNIGLGHVLNENVFETSFRLNKLFTLLGNMQDKPRIVIDTSGCDGATATAVSYSASRILGGNTHYTVVESLPLYGIPAYPGSPRWLHRVYVFGRTEGLGRRPSVQDYPRNIEWRGSRGIYIALSRVFNAIASCGCLEKLVDGRREILGEGEKLEAWMGELGALQERRRLFVIDELKGPDENTAKHLYTAWKGIVELIGRTSQERQGLDRMIMQIQRYVGAADLIAREIVSQSKDVQSLVNEKLHRILLELSSDKNWIAVVPDTNLFYQGFHMALLKASIRAGSPWSPIRGLSIYIPRCAEAEINGKVAETNPDSGIPYRISYTLALLANRALLETKYYYDAESLSATAQPCEAAIAVEAPNLSENRILLLTADHKAFMAWQTLNVCRGKVSCIYIAHSDQPLSTDTIYGKFYASISASLLAYTTSLFLPVTLSGSRGSARLVVKGLKGNTAPIIGVYKTLDEKNAERPSVSRA